MTFYFTAHSNGKPFTTGVITAVNEVQAMHFVEATIARKAATLDGIVRVHLTSPEQPLRDHFFNYRGTK